MKKILRGTLSVVLAILMFSAQAVAYTTTSASINTNDEISAVTDFDESEIYQAFGDVENLVATIESNENITYSDLEATNSEMIADVSSSAAIAMSSTSADAPPFISAFLWGCLFNLAGMLIVGITTDFDEYQLKKSAWGCLINVLVFGGSSVFYW